MKKILILIVLSFLALSCNRGGEGTRIVRNDDGTPVNPPVSLVPRDLSYPLAVYEYRREIAIDEIYPTYHGSYIDNFSISPALPTGLHFSSLSGRIAGTPEADIAPTLFTITGTNALGSVSTAIMISVKAQNPFGLRYLNDVLNLTKNDTIVDLYPEFNEGVRGGAAITSFNISPSVLPAGIVFNSFTGTISGIATENFPLTVFTITGTNSGGSTSTSISMEVSSAYSKLVAGGKHNCVLIDGKVHCWGDNAFGQLGDGTNTTSGTMKPLVGFNGNVQKLYAGSDYSCLLSNQYDSYCWGSGAGGQLGNGVVGDKNTATLSVALGKMSELFLNKNGYNQSSVVRRTCGNKLLDDGDFYCWGSNNGFNFSANNNREALVYNYSALNEEVEQTPAVLTAGVGDGFYCFILDKLYCKIESVFDSRENAQAGLEGQDAYNMLDLDFTPLQESLFGVGSGRKFFAASPLPTVFNVGVLQMTTGQGFSCAYNNIGQTFCWGYNDRKQLGNSSVEGNWSATPVLVEGLPEGTLNNIKAGKEFACGVINFKVYCWGSNIKGQLGRGESGGFSPYPQSVRGAEQTETVSFIATAGQTEIQPLNQPIKGVSSVSVNGVSVDFQIIKDNRPETRGSSFANDKISLDIPLELNASVKYIYSYDRELTDVTEISLGDEHACVISKKQIYCWGDNSSKQIKDSAEPLYNRATLLE